MVIARLQQNEYSDGHISQHHPLCGDVFVFGGWIRVGLRNLDDDATYSTHAIFEGAIFALLGLLLAFAFAGSMSRYDERRNLIVREANTIGTAYLRIDLLPPAFEPELRALFHSYLEARLKVFGDFEAGRNSEPADTAASGLQQQIWAKAVEARSAGDPEALDLVVIPAINEMIDVTTARSVAMRTQTPRLILGLLLGMALVTSMIAGYNMAKAKRRSPIHGALYALSVSLTIYVILDLDNPQRGLVRLDTAERAIRQLQRTI
jgi:hypothetical protein